MKCSASLCFFILLEESLVAVLSMIHRYAYTFLYIVIEITKYSHTLVRMLL